MSPVGAAMTQVPDVRVRSLQVRNLSVQHGGVLALEPASFDISTHQPHGRARPQASRRCRCCARWPGAVRALPDHIRRRRLAAYPMGRAVRIEEVSNAVLFLASDESTFTTGSEIRVDGGALAGLKQRPARHDRRRHPDAERPDAGARRSPGRTWGYIRTDRVKRSPAFPVLDERSRCAQTVPAEGQPEDVANAVLFYASARSRVVGRFHGCHRGKYQLW
jgi:NAD(P)-dependent dehydrogenase (short-subunit alcohol dehydrogenase family)